MANKQNDQGWKLAKLVKRSSNIKDELWYDTVFGLVDIYRNHKKVHHDHAVTEQEAIELFDKFFEDYDKKVKTLNEYLEFSNLKLTKLEKTVIESIMGEGSYYEECACWKDTEDGHHVAYVDGHCFIGWDIDEKEVPGCRGAISSLVRKGILNVFDDECNGKTIQGYSINQTPEFKKGGFYHELDIREDLIKQ